jgi:hypothetical protein
MAKMVMYSVFCFALVLLCISSGCSSSKSSDSGTAVTTTTVSVSEIPSMTPTEVSPVKETTPVTTTSVQIATTTTIEKSSFSAGVDDPQLLNLIFKPSYLDSAIPNCIMGEAFPQVAKDSTYGIKQPKPKIIAISPKEINVFLREYTEGKNEQAKTIGITRCDAVPVNPYWNFVKVDATIMPRNANPADYEIGLNVRSAGKIIAQYPVTETLTINQPLYFESYIPLKSEEMAFFDSVELVFHKKTN